MTDFTRPENQHPVLKLFPLMSEEDLKELAADIKANGQRTPAYTVRGANGNPLLVDGQNRIAACKIAGVVPNVESLWDYEDVKDDDAVLSLVLSANLKRRHLTPAQRGAIVVAAAEMTTHFAAEAKERQKAALAAASAERKRIAEAAKLIKKDPEAAEEILKQMPKDAKPMPAAYPGLTLKTPPIVVLDVAQPPSGRTNEKLAAIAHVSPALITKLAHIQKHAPDELKTIIAKGEGIEQATRVADRRREEERTKAKTENKSKKAKANKPRREFGIWKVGAVLLGSTRTSVDCYYNGGSLDMPFLFEVTEVRKTHAKGRILNLEHRDEIEFRMSEKSGVHDAREHLKAIRVATAADKKMVERVWETVKNWK
jgi:ParB-like chromosome segregation protein Spo0J